MIPHKTIGILGGMGPYATLSFYEKLLNLTSAKKDWDYPRIIIDMNTKIPSRSRYYLYEEESPIPSMIDSCLRLQSYPVDFIVIPCNSASSYLSQVQSKINIPILNIMEITVKGLAKHPKVSKVAVLGGVVTYENRIYEPYLIASGYRYVHHSKKIQTEVEKIIERIKLNEPEALIKASFDNLLKHLEADVDAFIFGCTEFGCLSNIQTDIPCVDSSTELAEHSIIFSGQEVKDV